MLEKVKNTDPLGPVNYKSESPVEDFKRFEDVMRQIVKVPPIAKPIKVADAVATDSGDGSKPLQDEHASS